MVPAMVPAAPPPPHRRLPPRPSAPALALALAALAAAGCAGLRGRAGGPAEAPPQLAGVWEGVARETVAQGMGAGDTRIERQAWHLTQNGRELFGFYVLELTMISGDGRPYLCSQEPRFSTVLRFEVRGHAVPGRIELAEVGDVLARGPCQPTFHSPSHFQAELKGDSLLLTDGDHRIVLYRRPKAEQKAAAAALVAFERPDASFTPSSSFPTFTATPAGPPADVQGTWTWESRTTIPTGDEKFEREEWHLVQEGGRVTGYYDRAVRQVSTDGNAYRCSNTTDFRVLTRYRIAGEVRGRQLVLHERAFEVLEGSPCDSGQRRLDSYQGETDGGEIRLRFGVGQQVLRRARPNVPTQRF
jgi:hypothetical protein